MADKKVPEVQTIEIDEVRLFEIDKAVYNWLSNKKELVINDRKVPVIFGAWERFAQMRGDNEDDNLNSLRDKNGMLKLPITSIRRNDVEPLTERYMKTSVDGQPGITFAKKIAQAKFSDRRVPVNVKWKSGNRYKTANPVYEIYSLPFPVFIRVPYTLTFWSSFVSHSNMFHDQIWTDYHPAEIEANGFFFYSSIDSSSDESNIEDFSSEERVIRHSFVLNVEAYIIEKDKVKIDRSVSRFAFKESLVDLEDFETDVETPIWS